MKNIVMKFGLIAGAIVSTLMAISLTLCLSGRMNFDHAEVVGYTSMILAFLLVFFGIRSYRDNVSGGTISFGKAFKIGILITVVASVFYVVAWEIVYFNFIPDFVDKYAAHVLDKLRAAGATEATLAAEAKKMARFKELYANPLINAAMTFMEPFPVGLIVTLVSAAILRRKSEPDVPIAAGVTA